MKSAGVYILDLCREDNMAFCGQCGAKNDDNNRFCALCGAPIRVAIAMEKDNAQQTHTATIQSVAQPTRKDVYEGVIHKCPNCGSTINGMEIQCSTCGHEFRTENVTGTVQTLSQRLDQLEAQRKDPSKASLIMKSFGLHPSHDKITVAKANAISSFPIPTTKEDILEFMILASANVNGDVIAGSLYEQERIANEDLKVEQNAWYSKMEQAYNKAKISFGSDPVFVEVERIYTQKKKEVNLAKRKYVGKTIGLFLIPASLLILLLLLCP